MNATNGEKKILRVCLGLEFDGSGSPTKNELHAKGEKAEEYDFLIEKGLLERFGPPNESGFCVYKATKLGKEAAKP